MFGELRNNTFGFAMLFAVEGRELHFRRGFGLALGMLDLIL